LPSITKEDNSMFTIEQLTEFLGWTSVLVIGYLLIAAVLVVVFKDVIISIHSKLFGIEKSVIELKYFEFLSNFKVVATIFVILPYLALKIMA